MHNALVLSLTGDRLILELLRSETPGLRQVLRGIFRRQTAGDAHRACVSRVELAGPMLVSGELSSRLEHALSQMHAQCGDAVVGASLEAQLGLDHAQIGLVDLSGVARGSMAAGNCDTYAQAWVAQMLHMDPAAAIVRWELLEPTQRLLVSCVRRDVVETLNDFCKRSGLRFASCRPAVLSVLERNRAGGVRDLAWTEVSADGCRSARLQLLRLQGRTPSSLWRGWVPFSDSENGMDAALDGAIGRFQRINSPASGVEVDRIIWPVPAVAGASN